MSRHGPRSKRLLLGPGHRAPRSGCPLKLLIVLALALASMAGGWWFGGWSA